MKYHLTPDGPRKCTASVKTCKYGSTHFEELNEAEQAFADSFSGNHLVGTKALTDGESSAATSRAYAHWSIINLHLHNAGSTGSDQEITYYSSPQGRLELARRIRQSTLPKEYEEILSKIDDPTRPVFSYELDEEKLKIQVKTGSVLAEEGRFLKNYEPHKNTEEEDQLQHFLVEKSHEWLKRLTPEEQEAVSWLTSNGGGMLNYSYGYSAGEYGGNIFKGLLDEDAIYSASGYEKYLIEEENWDWTAEDNSDDFYERGEKAVNLAKEKIANEYRKLVVSAFSKAPKLAKPITIVRGTSLTELQELTNFPKDSNDFKSLMDSIEAGEYSGKTVGREARLVTVPQSATVNKRIAGSFAKQLWSDEATEDREVMVYIKGSSFASPVNVSAWSTSEYEVLTNPLSSYKIVKGRREGDDLFILELEEI